MAFKDVLDAINTQTNTLGDEISGAATRVGALITKAHDEGLTAEEQAEADSIVAKLNAGAATLHALAADQSNPVPPPVEPVPVDPNVTS